MEKYLGSALDDSQPLLWALQMLLLTYTLNSWSRKKSEFQKSDSWPDEDQLCDFWQKPLHDIFAFSRSRFSCLFAVSLTTRHTVDLSMLYHSWLHLWACYQGHIRSGPLPMPYDIFGIFYKPRRVSLNFSSDILAWFLPLRTRRLETGFPLNGSL